MDWKEALLKQSGYSEEELRQAGAESREPVEETPPRKSDTLSIFIEKKGRGGKTATIIAGFTCDEAELREIAARLKTRLGCGGSARGGEILIQGERRQEAAAILRQIGYKVSGAK